MNSEPAAVCSQQNKKAATETDSASQSSGAAAAAKAVTVPAEAPSKEVRVTEPAGLPASSSSTPQKS